MLPNCTSTLGITNWLFKNLRYYYVLETKWTWFQVIQFMLHTEDDCWSLKILLLIFIQSSTSVNLRELVYWGMKNHQGIWSEGPAWNGAPSTKVLNCSRNCNFAAILKLWTNTADTAAIQKLWKPWYILWPQSQLRIAI